MNSNLIKSVARLHTFLKQGNSKQITNIYLLGDIIFTIIHKQDNLNFKNGYVF